MLSSSFPSPSSSSSSSSHGARESSTRRLLRPSRSFESNSIVQTPPPLTSPSHRTGAVGSPQPQPQEEKVAVEDSDRILTPPPQIVRTTTTTKTAAAAAAAIKLPAASAKSQRQKSTDEDVNKSNDTDTIDAQEEEDTDTDLIGEELTQIFNTHPNFCYGTRSRQKMRGRRKRRRSIGTITGQPQHQQHHADNETEAAQEEEVDTTEEEEEVEVGEEEVDEMRELSFRPLLSGQNYHRIRVLGRCVSILLRFLLQESIPALYHKTQHQVQQFWNQKLYEREHADPSQYIYELPNLLIDVVFRGIVPVLGLLFVFGLGVATLLTVGSIRMYQLGQYYGSLVVFSFLVDAQAISTAIHAHLLPAWWPTVRTRLGTLARQVDRVLLKGNRWRGREWNTAGFVFDTPSNQAVSAVPIRATTTASGGPAGGEGGQQQQKTKKNRLRLATNTLWKLPPPNVLERAYKTTTNPNTNTNNYNNNNNSNTNTNPNTNTDNSDTDTDQTQWGRATRDHVAAIDYSYLVLREQFLQEQYSKLQRHYAASVSLSVIAEGMGTSTGTNGNSEVTGAGGENGGTTTNTTTIRQRLQQYDPKSFSTYETFREKFVRDHHTDATTTIDPYYYDGSTGLSLKLQELLEAGDDDDDDDDDDADTSFDDDGTPTILYADGTSERKNSNRTISANRNNATGTDNLNNPNQSIANNTVDEGDDRHRRDGNHGSFDSSKYSDGTTTMDMNWMDVGTEIGMKLFSSAAVQKAMASQDTIDKFNLMTGKVPASSRDTSDSTSHNFFHDDDYQNDTGHDQRPRDYYSTGEDDLDNSYSPGRGGKHTAAEKTPVHPMWTSAAAAAIGTVSPTHSCATIETNTTGTENGDGHFDNNAGDGAGDSLVPTVDSNTSSTRCPRQQLSPSSERKQLPRNLVVCSSPSSRRPLSPLSSTSPPSAKVMSTSPRSRNQIDSNNGNGPSSSPSERSRHSSSGNNCNGNRSHYMKKYIDRRGIHKHGKQHLRASLESISDPSMEMMIVSQPESQRGVLIKQASGSKIPKRRPLLLSGVKIAVPIIPVRPPVRTAAHVGSKPKVISSQKLRSRYQMATVVTSKRISVHESDDFVWKGTNCLSITVDLDKSFLRNGSFANLTIRIMDEWNSRYMPKHSILPIGSCVATCFGLGVLVGWRVEDDMHLVRSLWQRRGSGSACAYLRRDSIQSTVEAAVGFDVLAATVGRGTIVAYTGSGGSDFRSGRYLVSVAPEDEQMETPSRQSHSYLRRRLRRHTVEANRCDILSCNSAQYVPIIEHIRSAAMYQLQIDRYTELSSKGRDTSNEAWGTFSRHFTILWKSFLRAIEEDDEFDDGMNEFIQSCVNFLNQLDAPSGKEVGESPVDDTSNRNKYGLNLDAAGSFVIHDTESTKSQSRSQHSNKLSSTDTTFMAEQSFDKTPADSGFGIMDSMFDIFYKCENNNGSTGGVSSEYFPQLEGIEIQFTPRRRRRIDKNYARAFAILRTLTRTVTIAQAASADEPEFKMGLSICHEILLFAKTVIKVQQKNTNHDSIDIWRAAWSEIVSVFGPSLDRLKKIGEGIAERMEHQGRRAKVRLLRLVDFIVQDESLFLAMEQGDWNRCALQIELAMVHAKIIDESSRDHYHKTAKFLYNHFSAATSRSNSAADRNSEKLSQFLLAIQLIVAPRKSILKLLLHDWIFDLLERIFVRAFAMNELATRMLTIHCSNFQNLRRLRMLKDFSVAGKLWIPIIDAADEEFSWAVSKLPEEAKMYILPISNLFSLCVSQFHKNDKCVLQHDWLDFLMEDEAAEIINDLDMKLILALESFSCDIKQTMVVLPYYPDIDSDILNLVDDINIDEFVKEASVALEDETKLREFIKEKSIIAIERFLDYLPKMSIPVEKRELGDGWTLTCRSADGGDLSLTELNIKRENLTCQVMGGDSIFFPADSCSRDSGTQSGVTNTTTRLTKKLPLKRVHIVKETSILDVIKEIILNAQHDGCWEVGIGGIHKPPSDNYAASALDNLPVSCVLNCGIDLWRNLEIDDDELLEIAIRDVSYQIELHNKNIEEKGSRPTTSRETNKDLRVTATGSSSVFDSWPDTGTSSSNETAAGEPLLRHRFNPRVDPTILFLELKKLTFNLENFQFQISKHEALKTMFDPTFEGSGSILVRNVLIRFRVECVKRFITDENSKNEEAVPVLQLQELDVSLEEVQLEVHDTGADWVLNKIVERFGDRFAEIISANLCEQVRTQLNEALGSLNEYFKDNADVLLSALDISLDDLAEMTVFV